ncbi:MULTISPECIES: response regulator [unclassified Frigoribacterium]|uniref:response regulator n=1 Tax=unclassified Frigoribacterium TaxID=2627005 RepID=UPI000FC11A89|nr:MULTISPECIES: response regulator [unclassified Frigoribacterium]ROP75734.1 response regulator of citrate/malate metabolism [Frigoribacterium sp. PhB107]TDT64278.1 response regulator of citrate/malate metabolism [Frigoribacterium sp. PhB116]
MTDASSSRPLPPTTPPVRVLVVDDEPLTAEAHGAYVTRLDGFELVGVVHDGRSALDRLRQPGVDLVLLDLTLPDIHGIQLCRALRAAGSTVDVVAITAVRDVAVVKSAVSLGIVQYLIKPFGFATFAERLTGYLAFRRGLDQGEGQVTQTEVDASLATLRTTAAPSLAKGIAPETLAAVVEALRTASDPAVRASPALDDEQGQPRGGALSAGEVAAAVAVSRVTARRYLEHLADAGQVDRVPRYGAPGRPEHEYRWR